MLLALVLVLNLSNPVTAGGSFSFSELEPILRQAPVMADYLLATLDFAEVGVASRIGSIVNERLGGKRLGPYRIQAKPRGSQNSFVFEVTVHTTQRFLDDRGKETTLEKATSVAEKFERIEIRPIRTN